jgi:cell division protein FtsA
MIIKIGKFPSEGLKKSIVVDIARIMHSIKKAMKEIEITSGYTIKSAYVGIFDGHIQLINSYGMIPIKGGFIRLIDITNALMQQKPSQQGIIYCMYYCNILLLMA